MTPDEFKGYATREAAAILAHFTAHPCAVKIVDLLVVAWLQGAIYGSHETLADAEIAYQKVRAEL